jgi:hypothetical protein
MENHIHARRLQNSLKLPQTTLIHHRDIKHVEKRRQELENYLKNMYVQFSPLDFSEFDIFLVYSLNVNQFISEEETMMIDQQYQQFILNNNNNNNYINNNSSLNANYENYSQSPYQNQLSSQFSYNQNSSNPNQLNTIYPTAP